SQADAEQARVAVQLVDLLAGNGGDEVRVGLAEPGTLGVGRLIARAVVLQGEPIGVILAVFRPKMSEGVTAVELETSSEPVPREPVGGCRLRPVGLGHTPVMVRTGEAEPIEPHLEAGIVAQAADAALG